MKKLNDNAEQYMYLDKPIKVFKCKTLEFNKDLNTYKNLKMTLKWRGLWISSEMPSPENSLLNPIHLFIH